MSMIFAALGDPIETTIHLDAERGGSYDVDY
jgi:hypothetical protein